MAAAPEAVVQAEPLQARDLQSLYLSGALPAQGAAFAQPVEGRPVVFTQPVGGPEVALPQSRNEKLKRRVVLISIVTAVYIVACTVIQFVLMYYGLELASEKARTILELQGVKMQGVKWIFQSLPSILMLYAIPGLLASVITGLLFAVCGLCGAKSNEKCCAGCYCCCNGWYCVLSVVTLLSMLVSNRYLWILSENVNEWVDHCDPVLCSPETFNRDSARVIDCLAPGAWSTYVQKYDVRIPKDCPPIFLSCNSSSSEHSDEDVSEEAVPDWHAKSRFLSAFEEPIPHRHRIGFHTRPPTPPRPWAPTPPRPWAPTQPRPWVTTTISGYKGFSMKSWADENEEWATGKFPRPWVTTTIPGYKGFSMKSWADENEEWTTMTTSEVPYDDDEDAAGEDDEEPASGSAVGEAAAGGDEAEPFEASAIMSKPGVPAMPAAVSEAAVSDFPAEFRQGEDPFNLPVKMPSDPLTACRPSKAVELFKVAKDEVPMLWAAVSIMCTVRILCLLPLMLLWTFGFWWGMQLWSNYSAGYSHLAMHQVGTQMQLVQPSAVAATGEHQLQQMAQPLIVQPAAVEPS